MIAVGLVRAPIALGWVRAPIAVGLVPVPAEGFDGMS